MCCCENSKSTGSSTLIPLSSQICTKNKQSWCSHGCKPAATTPTHIPTFKIPIAQPWSTLAMARLCIHCGSEIKQILWCTSAQITNPSINQKRLPEHVWLFKEIRIIDQEMDLKQRLKMYFKTLNLYNRIFLAYEERKQRILRCKCM